MGTNVVDARRGRGRYQHHSREFKRAVVELTLQPGASVARIAREHGVNANQVFAWRRLFRDGKLDAESASELVAVELAEPVRAARRSRPADGGSLIVECARGRLHIEGRPDALTLRLVLEQLLQ
jgi:transposase